MSKTLKYEVFVMMPWSGQFRCRIHKEDNKLVIGKSDGAYDQQLVSITNGVFSLTEHGNRYITCNEYNDSFACGHELGTSIINVIKENLTTEKYKYVEFFCLNNLFIIPGDPAKHPIKICIMKL